MLRIRSLFFPIHTITHACMHAYQFVGHPLKFRVFILNIIYIRATILFRFSGNFLKSQVSGVVRL